MTYREQIRSPEWIKFAAKMKEDADWTCQSCGSLQGPDSELTIHHIHYLKGVKMWEHPPEIMECVCWPCHKVRQNRQSQLFAIFAEIMAKAQTKNLHYHGMLQMLSSPSNWPGHELQSSFDEELERCEKIYIEALREMIEQNPELGSAWRKGSLFSVEGNAWKIAFKTEEEKAAVNSGPSIYAWQRLMEPKIDLVPWPEFPVWGPDHFPPPYDL